MMRVERNVNSVFSDKIFREIPQRFLKFIIKQDQPVEKLKKSPSFCKWTNLGSFPNSNALVCQKLEMKRYLENAHLARHLL